MTTKEPFSCIFKAVFAGKPEKEWESNGTRYIWGLRYEYAVTGDFKGAATSIVNGKTEPSTGDGIAFGNSILNVKDSKWGPGTFELRWTCKIKDEMIISGEIIGKGTKNFAEWKLMGSIHDIEPHVRLVEGHILNPRG